MFRSIPRSGTKKAAIIRRVKRDRTLDRGTRKLALLILCLADDDGVIHDDALYALVQEMEREDAAGGSEQCRKGFRVA